MSYSDLYLRNRNNSLLGALAVVVLVIFGFFLYFTTPSQFPTPLPSQAVNKALSRHELVNVSAYQAGVFWQSAKAETGWVAYGTSQNELTITSFDERDVGERKNEFNYHYVPLKGLEPSTQYYYKIISGDRVFLTADNQPFRFRTSDTSASASSLQPAYGKIIGSNGQPEQNAVIILRYKNIVPLLTMTKVTGEWLIPLQFALDKDLYQPVKLTETEVVALEVIGENSANSQIETLVKNTNPLPQSIILGKDYKFLEEDNVLTASADKKQESKDYPISILIPTENAIIPGSRPLLKGQAIPGKQIKIQINSQPGYISRITADEKGEWYVNVPVVLGAGSYTMTVETENVSGELISLTRKFSLTKSGQQVLGEASPSATIIPTATPTNSPEETVTPTLIDDPTPTITLPLETATPISTASPSRLDVSGTPMGYSGNPVMFGGIGLIILGLGVLLAF